MNRYDRGFLMSKNKKERYAIDSRETERLKAVLFNSGSILVMIKKDDDYYENFGSTSLGLDGISARDKIEQSGIRNGGTFVQGFSRLVRINETKNLFENDRIEKILECLEVYLDYIGWDKVDDGNGLKFSSAALHESIVDEILETDRDLKDKWCALVSAFSYNSNNESNIDEVRKDVMERFNNRSSFENLTKGFDKLSFNMANSYLYSFFPINMNEIYFSSYNSRIKKVNASSHWNRLNYMISVLNDDSGKTLGEMNTSETPELMKYSDPKTVAAMISYFNNDFIHEINLDDMNREQFIDLMLSIRGFNTKKEVMRIIEFQKERIIQGHKIHSYQKPNGSFGAYVDFPYIFMFSDYEKEKFDEINKIDSKFLIFFKKFKFGFIDLFLKHPDSFVNFVEDYERTNDMVNDFLSSYDDEENEIISSSNFGMNSYKYRAANNSLMKLINNPNGRYRKAFEKFLKDPYMTFDMFLHVNGVIDDEYKIEDREAVNNF